MNQILGIKRNKKIIKYKFILFSSLLLIIFLLIYQLYIYYGLHKKEIISKNILSTFNLVKLYSSYNHNYTVLNLTANNSSSVIGIIEIPKIDIKYPILSNYNDELLEIAPCRFFGPDPNKIGNLCIAAHNYDDNRFFGNLKNLNVGDRIDIYDSNNVVRYYYVYNKFEISDTDISCTSQNTNNMREITLLTCNNMNKKRLIVKAKEYQNEGYI